MELEEQFFAFRKVLIRAFRRRSAEHEQLAVIEISLLKHLQNYLYAGIRAKLPKNSEFLIFWPKMIFCDKVKPTYTFKVSRIGETVNLNLTNWYCCLETFSNFQIVMHFCLFSFDCKF